MSALFSNNAYGFVNTLLTAGATTLVLGTGEGGRFPQPDTTKGTFFLATLAVLTTGKETAWEIVKCTARVGDTLTIVRGQETTGQLEWPVTTRVEHRITSGQANRMMKRDLILDTVIKNTHFTAAVGVRYLVNSTASLNITLPANVATDDRIGFVDIYNSCKNYPWVFLRNGKLIYNIDEDMTVQQPSFTAEISYVGNQGWYFV